MKTRILSRFFIIGLSVLVMLVTLPALVRMLVYKPVPPKYAYYSPYLKSLCFLDRSDLQHPMHDKNGFSYTIAESDSLLPFLNYRQLIADGRAPDSVCGKEVNMKIIGMKTVTHRFDPHRYDIPSVNINLMYESMPKRLGIEVPNDVFRLDDDIVFIDNESNSINLHKSQLFRKAMEKAGYHFPAQWCKGDNNMRKRYDEGFFSLDNDGQLFHIKMVNSRPYVRNTHVSDSIAVDQFIMYESVDKRFYGFIFDKEGYLYIICNNEGEYYTQKFEMDPLNIHKDRFLIMADPISWCISVETPTEFRGYAFDNESLTLLDKFSEVKQKNNWETMSSLLFPIYIEIENRDSGFIYPRFIFGSVYGFILNFLLATLMAIFTRGKDKLKVFISLTGICGLLVILLVPKLSEK